MNKALLLALTAFAALAAGAVETIYRGAAQDEKNVLCYYQGGKFYADAARKECLYAHPGHCVCKGPGPASKQKNALYSFNGGKMYKGASSDKKDVVATIVESRRRNGAVVEAKIYSGFVITREEHHERADKTDVYVHKVSRDGQSEEKVPALYTVSNGKVYKGDSTDDADCVMSYTGELTASRVLFAAVELLGR